MATPTIAASSASTGATVTEGDDPLAAALRRKLTPPPLPDFTIPVAVFTDHADQEVAAALGVPPGLYEGIAVVDARCNGDRVQAADAGVPTRGKDGSGHYLADGVEIVVNGDGSGSYTTPTTRIHVDADGSGTYTDGTTTLEIQGDRSGRLQAGDRTIVVEGDRSGSYADAEVHATFDADGSGTYTDATTSVRVNRDGAITAEGDRTHADAIAAVLRGGLSLFPPVPRIATLPPPAPGRSCGTVVRLDANVLFDLDQATIRPDAAAVLDRVAQLLVALGTPKVLVNGHTDSLGTEEHNQQLSEARAAAVQDFLVAHGVPRERTTAEGFGERQPLRPNTTPDGADDPAARQLNRRVEIVLPET